MKPKLNPNPDNIRFDPVNKFKLQHIAELEYRHFQCQVRKFCDEKIAEWERVNGRIDVPERISGKSQKNKGEK